MVCGRAEVWQSQEFNCSITFPGEGWTHVKPPNEVIQVSVRSPDRLKLIQVSVGPVERSAESYLEGLKKSFFEKGTGKIRIEERIAIDGHAGYRLKDIFVMEGKEVFKATTFVVNNDVAYLVDATGLVSDPMNDPAVKECVGSFHFLSESVSAHLASRQAVGKKIAPQLAAYIEDARSDWMIKIIANITVYTLIGIFVGYCVMRVVRDGRTTTKLPPPLYTQPARRTTPPPLPQNLANRSGGVGVLQKLDVN
jgi:hypothetical protein